jgi:asparagine synthase (glutamine-hydrolysing)
VTVALAGDGGDEAFAGYQKYAVDQLENRLRAKVPALLRRHLLPALGRVLKLGDNTLFRKGRTLINTLAVEPDLGFYMANAFCSDALWQQVCAPEFARRMTGYHPSEVTVHAYRHCDGHDHLSRILYADVKTYLPGDILVKVDRMSMANSLEVRAPIMDHEVFELAAQIPSRLKLNGSEKKYILKEAFKPLLSEETLYRRKMGFSVPLAQWLRVELRPLTESLLFASDAGVYNYLSAPVLNRIWQRHQSGKGDYGSILWSALCFELWWRRYANAR